MKNSQLYKGSLNTIILEVAGGEMVRCMAMKSLKSKGITQANSILRRRFVSTLLNKAEGILDVK
jgi:hypothetical protein